MTQTRYATLTNILTGETVHTTIYHPECSYGQELWVDDQNQPYMVADLAIQNPFYIITEDTEK